MISVTDIRCGMPDKVHADHFDLIRDLVAKAAHGAPAAQPAGPAAPSSAAAAE